MFVPATAVAGADFVIATSAFALTVVDTVLLLLFVFGSLLALETVAVLLRTVPFETVLAAFAVIVNCALWPLPNTAIEQEIVFTVCGGVSQLNVGPVSC